MNRRAFLATTAAAFALPGLAQAMTEYTPGLVKSELAAGKTVFIDFGADWCSTCARQERVINALRGKNPAYDENISFVRVDWDEYRTADITKSLAIPRRSTLVVLKGNDEIGRIVAGTSEAQIKELLDAALSAAVA